MPRPVDDRGLAAALSYASRGYRVFPLGSGSVGRFMRGTHAFWAPPGGSAGHTRATADAALIRQYWPVGAVPGVVPPEGCCILDLDEKHRSGVVKETFSRWPELRGNGVHLTKSGGAHVPAALPPDRMVKQSVNPALGIDVRVAGKGYVVAPPARGYSVLNEFAAAARLVAVPAELADLLWPAQRRVADRGGAVRPCVPLPHEGRRRNRYVAAAVAGEVLGVASAGYGCRNVRLHRAASALGTLVGAGCLSVDTVWQSLLTANDKNPLPLDRAEAVSTIRSGLDWGVRHPRDTTGSVA